MTKNRDLPLLTSFINAMNFFRNDNEDAADVRDSRPGITNGVTPSSAISRIARTAALLKHTFILVGGMFLCYNYLYRQIHFIYNNTFICYTFYEETTMNQLHTFLRYKEKHLRTRIFFE